MPSKKKYSRKSKGLTKSQKRQVEAIVKFPPSEFATVKIPRDPDARAPYIQALQGNMWPEGDVLRAAGDAHYNRRNKTGWRGRGDYSLAMGGSFSGLGLQGEGFLGARYTGQGDYTVSNALVGAGVATAGIPTFGPEQQHYMVTKSEFIQNLYGPATAGSFQNTVLPLNPGLIETFPWLALVAPQFEEYEFMQLMFYWRPMVSDFNSGTGQVGEIVMATQYNPSEPPFTDVQRAKNYMGAMSSKTSIPMNQGVECDPRKNSGAAGKYVRVGPLTGTNQDLKQYDLGNLNIMISGTPPQYSNQILGELWVAYTVCLRKPRLPDASGATILRDYFQSDTPAITSGNSSLPISSLATVPILSGAQNRIGGSVTWQGPQTFPGTGPFGALSVTAALVSYTVPNWYTGSLRLTLTFIGITVPNGGSVSDFNAPAGTTGNVKLLNDLADAQKPAGTPPNVDVLWQTTASSGVCNYSTYTGQVSATFNTPGNAKIIVDVDVTENTTGGANAVNIWSPASIAVSGASSYFWAGWTLDVTEYNSGFNGPTGKVMLTDSGGNAVLPDW